MKFPINECEINDYFDIIINKSTFVTLKNIFLQKGCEEKSVLADLDKKIEYYENMRKQWWTDTLNKYNYPFYIQKKTYVSRSCKAIIVE